MPCSPSQKGPSDGKPSTRRELRRFSDFVQREQDVITATVLIVALQVLALLPIATLHAQMVVNSAYAASLRVVKKRTNLMLSVFSAGMLRAPYRLWVAFTSSPLWHRLVGHCRRLCGMRASVAAAKPMLSTFAPTLHGMPTRLAQPGPFKLQAQWAKRELAVKVVHEVVVDESADATPWASESPTRAAHAGESVAAAPLWLGAADPSAMIVPMGQPPPPSEPPPPIDLLGHVAPPVGGPPPPPPPSPPQPDWLTEAAADIGGAPRAAAAPVPTTRNLTAVERARAGRNITPADGSRGSVVPKLSFGALKPGSSAPLSARGGAPSMRASERSAVNQTLQSQLQRAAEAGGVAKTPRHHAEAVAAVEADEPPPRTSPRALGPHALGDSHADSQPGLARSETAVSDTPSFLRGHDEDDANKLWKELARIEAVPPAPAEFCRLPASAERSFDPRFIRNVLRPIGLALSDLFGFQVSVT